MVERLYREAAVERAMKGQDGIMRQWKSNPVVASSGDPGCPHEDHPTQEARVAKNGVRWFVRPPMETAKSEAGAREGTGEDLGTVSGEVFGF